MSPTIPQPTNVSHDQSNDSHTAKKVTAVSSSMSGYWWLIRARQVRHFPRKASQLKTGTNSNQLSVRRHFGQAERPRHGEVSACVRSTTTLIKLPLAAPRAATAPAATMVCCSIIIESRFWSGYGPPRSAFHTDVRDGNGFQNFRDPAHSKRRN